MKIGEIDRNLKIEETVREPDILFQDVRDTEAALYGLHDPRSTGSFCRIPQEAALQVSPNVAKLALQTAGGRVRFATDSSYVAIRAEQPERNLMPHMPFLGSSGFDCYLRQENTEIYCGSFIPPIDRKDGYEAVIRFPDCHLREVTINFPLYDQVHRLFLGVQRGALIRSPRPYRICKPMVFYGSSITQGGCASRPGNSYEAILSRRLDCDYRNFGFSGSALGEEAMARYLAGLDMSAFVLDYDHNAPNADHLKRTHWSFYKIIRQAHSRIPIIIATRPDQAIWSEKQARDMACRQAVRETYDRAKAEGDDHVFWLEGKEIFRNYGGRECTVDGAHPNDLGFYAMADALEPLLRQA